jgi:hypothetical protein
MHTPNKSHNILLVRLRYTAFYVASSNTNMKKINLHLDYASRRHLLLYDDSSNLSEAKLKIIPIWHTYVIK